MFKKSKLSISGVNNTHRVIVNRGTSTRLSHKTTHIDFLESTNVVDLPNCNIQKDYVTPMYFGDDLDIQQNIINDLGGAFAPSPWALTSPPRNTDGEAFRDFQKFIEAQHKKHIELQHLKSLQDKLDRVTNEKCFEEDLVANNEATLKQISLDLSREDIPQNLRIIQDINSRIDGSVSAIAYKRTQTAISQEMASRRLEEASRCLEYTHSQALNDLKKMLDDEISGQQQMVDEIRFGKMDHYINQQIEATTQKHLDESLKLLKNHLNSLKTGQLKESLNNIGIEPTIPTSTANHLPSGFVYAPVYLGNSRAGGPDGPGGGGGGSGNGGSNGPGDDDFSDGGPGLGNIAFITLFWGVLVLIVRAVYSYLIQKLNLNSKKLLDILEKLFVLDQTEGEAHQLEVKPPRLTARLPSLVPLTVAAAGLVVSSYLFSPETLLRCLNVFFNLSALLGRALGRILLYVIPQPLQAVAILLGNGVAQVFSFTRRILIPAIMFSRTLMVAGFKLYVLFKLATFGVELCRLFSIVSPPWLKKGAQQVIEVVESSNQIEEVASITENPFLFGFLKSIVVFLFPFVPFPDNKGVKFASWALLMFLINRDTTYVNSLVTKLMEVPEIIKLLSCILGRFACVFIAINISKDLREKDTKFIIWLFYGSLYYYKVFGLALSASSNLLPV